MKRRATTRGSCPPDEAPRLRQVLAALQAAGEGDLAVRLAPDGPGLMSDIAQAFNLLMDARAKPTGPLPQEETCATGGAQEMQSLQAALQQVGRGDFSTRLPTQQPGVTGDAYRAFNDVAALNEHFACEMGRLARLIGQEGHLTERASLGAVSGDWEKSIDALNSLIGDLVQPSSEVARVITAVAGGDLTQTMSLDINGRPLQGEFLRVGTTVNTMVDQLSRFAEEVTRVAREVGSEGKLGGQAHVKGVAGTWQDLTDNVNLLAGNLTSQVRNIALVTTAVANGDLSQKITVDVRGEIQELKNTINTMVDQLRSFASEVTRVAREVGNEGKLGGQAYVKGVSGTWKDLTDNVNVLADNLTSQVRDVAKVATAIAKGDLTQKITVDVRGEILQIKETINTMVDQLSRFAEEVTRVAREVGIEGRLGGQAQVPGVAGTWKDLTEKVNLLAGNLTTQVRAIALVTTAVANGDLSRKITVDVRGEIQELKNTINTMVDQLRSFASEVTRMAREVGSEGKLGGQAYVKGVSGTWKDLTDTVNSLAGNLTVQLRDVSKVATAIAKGDLSRKITVDVRGEMLQIKESINTMVDQLSRFAEEVTRVASEVGTEGRLGGQAQVPGVAGTWKELTDNVNRLAGNLTVQLRDVSEVATAIARGDLSRKITVDVRGEMLQIKETINTMVDQLSRFAEEVTRVAREVGTEGKLGGQAQVKGVSGTWMDLTDNVNLLAGNLTVQLRDVSRVATAIAHGDLSQKITADVRGEILQIKDVINQMVDQLNSFASEVTRVAREVGSEGKLGGQAHVKGVSGTWKDLTDNVNLVAGNLTTQVRAIAKVSTAVTKGDLTRQITVDAQGEVSELKDNINQMIANLKETTQKNEEQDWLKSNLAMFSGILQGQKRLDTVSRLLMSKLPPLVTAAHGAFFLLEAEHDAPILRRIGSYAYQERANVPDRFKVGEGLVGQCALDKKPIMLAPVPSDFVQVVSGIGAAPPLNLLVLPVLFEGEVKAVIELASFQAFRPIHLTFLEQLMASLGVVLNIITTDMRTEELLQELKKSNGDLEAQAKELAEKAGLLEVRNKEAELASVSLEERAEQLALLSKYKSDFLANMSHELRTPLNSLMILAKLLSENKDGNLSPKQVEYATTIHSAGVDLLSLIDEILDLSKVEAGKMAVDARPVEISELTGYLERTFRPIAQQKGLDFEIDVDTKLPSVIVTDGGRLQQVLRNLLANALKFTDHGRVGLRIGMAPPGVPLEREVLRKTDRVLAFTVTDTGIGIPQAKQKIIFEAFQQADSTTSRKYGGTGLGLTISREIARLLGGEIHVESVPGRGSAFTLYLPQTYVGPESELMALGFDQRAYIPSHVSFAPSGRPEPEASLAGHEAPRPEAAAMPSSPEEGDPLADRTILLVDDDVRNLFAMTSVLEDHGLKVLVAGNGQEVLDMLQKHPGVDLILMDLMMPGMDGDETIRAIRRMPAFEDLPIIALTAKAMAGDREKSLQAGASDYLTKPVDADRLLPMMRSWLGEGSIRMDKG